MSTTSQTRSPRLSWVASHLELAEAVLALQKETLTIKAQLAELTKRCSGPRSRPINWRGITEALGALREVLSTPAMQALITGAMPLLAAFLRWLLRWLGS